MSTVQRPFPARPARPAGALGTLATLATLGRLGDRARRREADAGVAARYPAVRELSARGGTRVYVAHDVALDRLVVVKAIAPAEAAIGAVERFRREVRLMARLHHPLVAPVLAAGRARGVEYYVMPHLGDRTLAARLRDEGALPVVEALRLARALAGALEHVHAQGVVHRDVKPANVVLAGGHPVLVDFGIACGAAAAAGAAAGADARITLAGALVGTPVYMSPEQCGDAPVDARTDVYALGCVLHEMLTGTPPFAGRDVVTLCRRLREPPPAPSAARGAVPPMVDRIVARALALDADARFVSAGALALALDAALDAPLEAALDARESNARRTADDAPRARPAHAAPGD